MSEQVFKYCDSRGLDVLRNLELKVTPPNQFNDPFEFTPRFVCSSPSDEVERLFQDANLIEQLYQELKRKGMNGNFQEFKTHFEDRSPTFRKDLADKMSELTAHTQSNHVNVVSQTLGVLCMSENPHSIVMWGHYADKHQGFVIGFDRSWSRFHDRKGMLPVEYVRERSVWDTSFPPNSVEREKASDMMIFSKNEEWKYERELRQLFALENLKRRKLDNGSEGFFLSFPSDVVLSVHMGVRCPPEREKAIRALLKTPELAHVKLFKASLHEEKFALKFG